MDTYEVCQHDAKVHTSTEDACAEAPDRLWCHLGDVDRSNNDSLTYPQTRDQARSVDLAEPTSIGEEDDNAENPHDTKLSGGPETTNSVGEQEGESSTTNRADLNHGRHVALDVCKCYLIQFIET